MRVAFITDQKIMGGGERNLLSLTSSLSKTEDITVFTNSGFLAKAFNERGVTVRINPIRSRWLKFIPVRDRSLERDLREFDVVHAYSVSTVPALFGHPKAVWTIHGPWEKPFGGRSIVAERWLKHAVAVSEDVRAHCRFRKCPVTAIPLGSLPEDSMLKAASETISVANSCVRLGVLGRFQFIKGQDLSLKAAKIVAGMFPDRQIILQLCGSTNTDNVKDVEYFNNLRKEAESIRIGNLDVEFLGHSDSPLTFIDAQDLIVVPSRYESFSMTTIEALARGKPVVVPDIGGPKEIIGGREGAGLMFDPCSAESLANSISRVLAGHRFNASEIFSRANYFSVEKQAYRHTEIYRTL